MISVHDKIYWLSLTKTYAHIREHIIENDYRSPVLEEVSLAISKPISTLLINDDFRVTRKETNIAKILTLKIKDSDNIF